MDSRPKRLHLFQGYGVELEYMIADRPTMDVRPFSDRVLVDDGGHICEEVERGVTAWSNELVGHVIELKSNGPKADLVALHDRFVADIKAINSRLSPLGACLMPTAMHPWMNPMKETVLWTHGHNEIYSRYDAIFNCKGHGWSNLQSVHINLPFHNDEEFGHLHAAIRFLLPILPVVAASSPIMDGKDSGFADARLFTYERNQARIPVLTGKVIPEPVFTEQDYHNEIYDPIANAIAPFDEEGLMKPIWLNSRGAIARFDRGAIEIRIIDIQECPKADLALVSLITTTLKWLVSENGPSFQTQKEFETEKLYQIYQGSIRQGSQRLIDNVAYLRAFGVQESLIGMDLWKHILENVSKHHSVELAPWLGPIQSILEKGNLSERIRRAVNGDYSKARLAEVYSKLIQSLETNTLFGL